MRSDLLRLKCKWLKEKMPRQRCSTYSNLPKMKLYCEEPASKANLHNFRIKMKRDGLKCTTSTDEIVLFYLNV